MNDRLENDAAVSVLFGAGLGLAVGAALGLLFAPQTGEETRRRLAERVRVWRGRQLARLAHHKEQAEARRAHAS